MSSRYNRPRTPPGPPPSQESRKSTRKPSSSSSMTSKPHASHSYDSHHYKPYSKSSSSSYTSSKIHSDDKYKSGSVHKEGSEKNPRGSGTSTMNMKYPCRDDTYSKEASRDYKSAREVNYPSTDRYSNKDGSQRQSLYYAPSYPSEKTRYSDKYDDKYLLDSTPSTYEEPKYSDKKHSDNYEPYSSAKATGRYSSVSRHNESSYYSTASPATYSSYGSYSSYGAYGSSYGGRGGTGNYGSLDYESKLTTSAYSNLDKVGQTSTRLRDKLPSGSYSEMKLGSRSRLYPDDDRQANRDYTPPHTSSARSSLQGVSSSSYSNYGHYSSPPHSPQRQYLNRYVIGDSVVYGPPGHYPKDFRSSPPRLRPSPPPSPQPLMGRTYSHYANINSRGYPPITGRNSQASASQYRSSSPATRRAASPRQPLSPVPRRPPSPRSPQLRGSYRENQMQNYEGARSKDRHISKASAIRSPIENSSNTRSDFNSRRDHDRRSERRSMGSREKVQDSEPFKRARSGEHNADYQHNSSRGWSSKETMAAASSNHVPSDYKDRRPRSLLSDARNSLRGGDLSRDRKREDSRERDKSRRLEDRLGPSLSQPARRSPTQRARSTRRATSPRDKRNNNRRHTDLRLWIESRKSEGGKQLTSPNRGRAMAKHGARTSDRSALNKRSRLGDPKRRLGGYKARRRALPMKRNKILKKYQRLTAKRGAKGGGSGRLGNQANRGKANNERNRGKDAGAEEQSAPGSTATIHRVIKKPKVLSQVNRMVLKPRIIRKPAQKLLKDPKDDAKNKTQTESQQSTRDASRADEKHTSSSSSAPICTSTAANSKNESSFATTGATMSSSSTAAQSSKRSSRSAAASTANSASIASSS